MTLTCPLTSTPICPLTGTPMSHWLHVPCDWRRPGVIETYDLFWSRQAQFGQLYPRPTREEVARFYEVDYYTHGDSHSATPPRKTFFDRLREHLGWRADYGTDITAKRLVTLADMRTPEVLEIGCGDGSLLAALDAMGCPTVGIEPDPVAREIASDRGLEIHDGTAEDPPREIQDRRFDIVVLQHVLEHCLDPLRALLAAAAQLKPEGLVVVETPNNEAAGCEAAGVYWPWLDVPRHLNFFTGQSLSRSCLAVGLQPLATEFTGYTRQFQPEWLAMERTIRRAFATRGYGSESSPKLAAWHLLRRTAFAAPPHKYDSVRVVARKRHFEHEVE